MKDQIKGTCTPLYVSLIQLADVEAGNYSVYFSADSSQPLVAEKALIAAFAQRHAACKFSLEGHTGAEGSREYNFYLSQRMADSIAQIMQDNGIAKNQMETVSFGEERAQTIAEDADARDMLNRRVKIIARCDKGN